MNTISEVDDVLANGVDFFPPFLNFDIFLPPYFFETSLGSASEIF